MDEPTWPDAPPVPVDPWDAPLPDPADEPRGDAALESEAGLPPDGPYAFDPAEETGIAGLVQPDADAADVLHMERKLPRHLHLWFAGSLALLTLAALGVQSWLVHPARPSAKAPGSGAPPHEDDPPLVTLQRELAREKGEGSRAGEPFRQPPARRPPPAGGPAYPANGALAAPLPATAVAPGIAPVAGGRGPDTWPSSDPGSELSVPGGSALPPELLPVPAAEGERRYEQAQAQAVIAGSRILALNHAPATLPQAEGGGVPATDKAQLLASLLRAAPEAMHSLPELLGAGREALAGLSGLADGARDGGRRGSGAAASEAGGLLRGPANDAGASAALMPSPPARAPVILEGTPIPCVLQTEVRSDLPGMIVAQVAEDVYDSVTAQQRLIPRGTRLVGHYDSQVAGGQQRLMASFHRLILPDGASLDLQRMEAADAAGSAGLEDQVDTHFLARFGQSFLTAGLARAAQRDGAPVASSTPGGVLPGPDAAGQILVDTARTSLQMGSTVAPSLIIRRGTLFNVMVNRDLRLPELGTP